MRIIDIIIAVAGSFGGIELIKWFYTRKSKERLSKAEADIESIKANKDEFYFLRERITILNQENTDLLKSLIEEKEKNAAFREELASLKAERKLKLCEVKCCKSREPQSGY